MIWRSRIQPKARLPRRRRFMLRPWSFGNVMLREALVTYEKTMPDNWQNFYTRSLLGGALAGQKNFVEAESPLISGYEGMKLREVRIPAYNKVLLQKALERLVQLYTDWGQPGKAAAWKEKLDTFNTVASAASQDAARK